MSKARRAAAALAPRWVKQRHETYSTARYRARVRTLGRDFAARHGLVVRHGPFEGLVYPDSLVDADFLVAKLLGTYERELHGVMRAWIAQKPSLVVNVGAAEGYFAVGLARALPEATVLAFEADEETRAELLELAGANGVADRIQPAGECTVDDLARLPRDDGVVLSDCEGCELDLMDPARVPALAAWELLVELHDFVSPDISTIVPSRFAETHAVERIATRERDDDSPAELRDLPVRAQRVLLNERRPGPMQWAWMRPRAA